METKGQERVLSNLFVITVKGKSLPPPKKINQGWRGKNHVYGVLHSINTSTKEYIISCIDNLAVFILFLFVQNVIKLIKAETWFKKLNTSGVFGFTQKNDQIVHVKILIVS